MLRTTTASRLPLLALAALALLALALVVAPARPAAAAPDPVVPFPVQTYTCDQQPPGWPQPEKLDPWCGTWDADTPVPEVPDTFPVATLGHITLHRISADDAETLFFYDAALAPAFPPLAHFTYTGFASNDCNDMLAYRQSSTRYYLGTFASGDERGYIGGCSNMDMFPNVLNGGYVSQTSANTGIDRYQRIRRQGDFSLRWTVSSNPLVVEGKMRPYFSVDDPHSGANYWLFDAVREGVWPPAGGTTVTPAPTPKPAPAVPPGSLSSQPPIVGPPIYRILGLAGELNALRSGGGEAKALTPRVGWFLGLGDVLGVRSKERPGAPLGSYAWVKLQAVQGGAVIVVTESQLWPGTGTVFTVEETPSLTAGRADVTGAATLSTPTATVTVSAGSTSNGMQRSQATEGAATPRARVEYDQKAQETTVTDVAGRVRVTPANAALAAIQLVPGQQVRVGRAKAGAPFDETTADLARTIPAPQVVRAGPASAVAPGRLSLRALRHSKCVRVSVASTRPARVMVTIFSGRLSVRLFGQRLVRFTRPGRVTTCIRVPRHARTFDVRTPLRFAVGYALGMHSRPGQAPTRPVIRPIRLIP